MEKNDKNNQDTFEETLEADSIKNNMRHAEYISGMYKNWFLDYASYVILERAVPYIYDGLKPVQRRILHAMKRLDDGRYNKVANIIGFTMQYHPHGDASIGDALVNLGQKDLLIDTQGNWGNIHTGDRAAAPRYIEARLSKFALAVVFNPKTTNWKLSYDGRNKEPIHLPVKFPLLLSQGVEGIAVGLASKILPHNFHELIEASIAHLNEKPFSLLPDFPTGGMIDCSRYNDGLAGGKIRVRARISKLDKKTLVINEIPYGSTTTSLIDSILNANEKGKIRIKKIDDNTAQNVEILIHLPAGVSSDQTIDGLFAFTDCEMSISPNNCIIEEKKPKFLGVTEILKKTVSNTVALLNLELVIQKKELEDLWHKSSLEKIFIENRIYNHIEECETWESIIETIDNKLEPFKKLLRKEVVYDDIVKLTEIKIKRISKYDSFKADDYIKSLEDELKVVGYNLAHIIEWAIKYYQDIKKKYGVGRERKTEIKSFDVIEAKDVVAANQKLYANKKDGFVGLSLKKDEFICECSDIDDVIVFLRDGKYKISRVTGKAFFGNDIIHLAILKKNDKRTIFNTVYRDGRDGNIMIKRFNVTAITRDKEYDLTKGNADSKILYFTANPNGEAEIIRVVHKPKKRLRNIQFDFDFSDIVVKGRNSQGNILTKNSVFKISLKESGLSTLGGRKIWFDKDVSRLNSDQRGIYLGEFSGDDKILAITKKGVYKLYSFDLSIYFEPDIILIEKFDSNKVFSLIYFEGEKEFYYAKRFKIEPIEKLTSLTGDHSDSMVVHLTADYYPLISVHFGGKHSKREDELIDVEGFITIKGVTARGKRISTFIIDNIALLEPMDKEPPREEKSSNNIEENPEPDESSSENSNNQSQSTSDLKDEEAEPKLRSLFNPEDFHKED